MPCRHFLVIHTQVLRKFCQYSVRISSWIFASFALLGKKKNGIGSFHCIVYLHLLKYTAIFFCFCFETFWKYFFTVTQFHKMCSVERTAAWNAGTLHKMDCCFNMWQLTISCIAVFSVMYCLVMICKLKVGVWERFYLLINIPFLFPRFSCLCGFFFLSFCFLKQHIWCLLIFVFPGLCASSINNHMFQLNGSFSLHIYLPCT